MHGKNFDRTLRRQRNGQRPVILLAQAHRRTRRRRLGSADFDALNAQIHQTNEIQYGLAHRLVLFKERHSLLQRRRLSIGQHDQLFAKPVLQPHRFRHIELGAGGEKKRIASSRLNNAARYGKFDGIHFNRLPRAPKAIAFPPGRCRLFKEPFARHRAVEKLKAVAITNV